jgi:hypothetical protein
LVGLAHQADRVHSGRRFTSDGDASRLVIGNVVLSLAAAVVVSVSAVVIVVADAGGGALASHGFHRRGVKEVRLLKPL